MITDQEVVQVFREIPIAPIPFTEAEQAGRKRQIFRGMSAHLWKDAHPAGCTRHLAVFHEMKVIPEYCFGCFKIVVEPRNVVELFKLLMVFEKISLPLDHTRKCMVECRTGAPGAYKGIVFCRGGEVDEVRKFIRKAVSEDISPQVSVGVKRGCSEYAEVYPRYAHAKGGGIMHYKQEWKASEDSFDNRNGFASTPPMGVADVGAPKHAAQSKGLGAYTAWEIFCMQFWLRYAATIGDHSYLAITAMGLPPIAGLKRPPFRRLVGKKMPG